MDNKNFNKALESYRMEIIDSTFRVAPSLPAESMTMGNELRLDSRGQDAYDAYSLTAILNSYFSYTPTVPESENITLGGTSITWTSNHFDNFSANTLDIIQDVLSKLNAYKLTNVYVLGAIVGTLHKTDLAKELGIETPKSHEKYFTNEGIMDLKPLDEDVVKSFSKAFFRETTKEEIIDNLLIPVQAVLNELEDRV